MIPGTATGCSAMAMAGTSVGARGSAIFRELTKTDSNQNFRGKKARHEKRTGASTAQLEPVDVVTSGRTLFACNVCPDRLCLDHTQVSSCPKLSFVRTQCCISLKQKADAELSSKCCNRKTIPTAR